MSDEDSRLTADQELRLHALNLATALHRDTIRLSKAEGEDAGALVIVDADRFLAFLLGANADDLVGSQESTGEAK